MRKILLFYCLFLYVSALFAQETYPVNGSYDERPRKYAFINATIVTKAGETVENGTMLVNGQTIEAVGSGVKVPKGYITVNLEGKYIYPSLIDLFSTYGLPETKSEQPAFGRSAPVLTSTKKGAYAWNEAIRPEIRAVDLFSVDTKSAGELKKIGFGAVQAVLKDGIARGSALFTTLAEDKENEIIIKPEVGAHYSFDKGTAKTSYPSSLMGSIALLRQTYYDSDWYKNQHKEYNISLDAFDRLQSLPQFFEVSDVLDILRADKVAKEFEKKYIIKTSGNEYQRIQDVKATGSNLIVPLNFPKAYDVEDPAAADQLSLAQLKHWELAPANPSYLEKAGVPFALTADGLENVRDFWPNLRKAIKYGLSEEQALRALTETPASFLGLTERLGSLEKGKLANFIITSDSLFKEGNVIYENWIQGKKYIANTLDFKDIRGAYTSTIDGFGSTTLHVGGKPAKYEAHIIKVGDTTKTKVNVIRDGDLLTFSFNPKGTKGSFRISGYISEEEPLQFSGDLIKPDGNVVAWQASYSQPYRDSSAKKPEDGSLELGKVLYPFVAFGHEEPLKQESVLLRNATVWTNEDEGVLEETDLLLVDGKIRQIGKNLAAGGATVIDATGKHITAGIIDEHSHIAISRGINEGTQSVTSEVRIADIINSEDVNIYRQLAGGVTASHILHGSANSIGGQSQLIKLRWGKSPEELKFGGNDGFIKFALGENVKQSNWGDVARVRFPQTRMGVEQVYVDAFTRAKEYKTKLADKNSHTRRDLKLDALVEILDNKRFITCHSYVQSEINMLMHVADSLGFKINTFTHILEGYKMADRMASRSIAGATFADWWAYKMEVQEAIPYNAYLMEKQGVVTAINSDDAEMARRLNQEAAKIVKYGGLSEEDAWKMVTLNPAKMLHIDDRVGSLKAGKDADVVVWSDNPLSIYARAEKTFVDGVKYWDSEADEMIREDQKKEKARIIAKLLDEKGKGATTQKANASPTFIYHCETLEEDAVDMDTMHSHN
ncbi:amidohydrolase family protein [Olivibacter sp. SDN3]|uniref:amidohydrolase family protein n=1 Tax=Olivibacter sp. SDN3 TaxID=2764720 RepID=UPI0016514CD9|nr:amidohydrolase family protein [Olivibacter sp. SDN3]QNL50723.1 amidohydrolase family protein [Olivibacter sp. SDN3]